MGKKSLKERLADKRANLGKKGGGYQYYLIKEGTHRFRHLPIANDDDFSIEAVTFFLGKEIGLVVSPATFGEKCALMKAYEELNNSKKAADRETAKKIKPGRKFFSPVIPYKDEKGKELDLESGPKLLVMAAGLCGQVIDLYLDEDEAGDFTDPKNGYDLKYKRTGKGKNDTEYTVIKCRPTRLADKGLARQTFSPSDMLREITPDYKKTKELLEKFLSLPTEDDDDSPRDKDRKDKKKKKKSRDF